MNRGRRACRGTTVPDAAAEVHESLGIILGVSSLIAMFAVSAGMIKGSRKFMTEIGGIELISIDDAPPPAWQEQIADASPGRTYADIVALRRGAPLLASVSPRIDLSGAKMTRLNLETNPRVCGAEPPFLDVEAHELEAGRFITDLDIEKRNRVVVVGRSLVEDLFPENPEGAPLGAQVRINGETFRIIGVFKIYESIAERKARLAAGPVRAQIVPAGGKGAPLPRPKRQNGWNYYTNKNRAAVIPLSTMQATFKSARMNGAQDDGPDIKLSNISVRIGDPSQIRSSLEQMRNVLTISHRGIQDFAFDTREEWFARMEAYVRSMRVSGTCMAAISLFIGGLGITNIMLASISHRIREIGIRRAVGARARDIFVQILVESVSLALIGGTIGVVCGFGLIEVLNHVAPRDEPPVVEATALLSSIAFAAAVGVLAGIYPGLKAARLSPLQALRYD